MTNNNQNPSNYNYWVTPEAKHTWHYRFVGVSDEIYWRAAVLLTDITSAYQNHIRFCINNNIHAIGEGSYAAILIVEAQLIIRLLTDIEAPTSEAYAAYATALYDWDHKTFGDNK